MNTSEVLLTVDAHSAPEEAVTGESELLDESFGPAVVLNAISTSDTEADGDAEGAQQQGVSGRKTLTRFCVSRVLWKVALAFVFYLAYTRLDMVRHLEDASAWIETLPPNAVIWVFLLMSTTFTALSPTGYLPTVLAGIVFSSRLRAWAVAYAQVNLGALLNAVLVRRLCRPMAQRMTRRRFGAFHWLNNALRQPDYGPVRVVALIRTPFLWGGFFNYLFALSDVYVSAARSVEEATARSFPSSLAQTLLLPTADSRCFRHNAFISMGWPCGKVTGAALSMRCVSAVRWDPMLLATPSGLFQVPCFFRHLGTRHASCMACCSTAWSIVTKSGG